MIHQQIRWVIFPVFITLSAVEAKVTAAVSPIAKCECWKIRQKSTICCTSSTILCVESRMSDPLTHFCSTVGDVTVGGACGVQNNRSVFAPGFLLPASCFWRLSPRNFGYLFYFSAPFFNFFYTLLVSRMRLFSTCSHQNFLSFLFARLR